MKEESHWQLGWWDLSHLLGGTRRPLVWSRYSVIFTAHPTEPLVLARHFPTSRNFTIPPPKLVLDKPASYGPPTVICVSPVDDRLFAYFPGRGGDGAGCLWKRKAPLDSWHVWEYWPLPQGAGAVAAAWTAAPREWIMTETSATRLPPRGPTHHLLSSVLLLVTQNHQINVYYVPPPPHTPSLKVIRASLVQLSRSFEGEPPSYDDTVNGIGGHHVCVNAAICLSYNESSILVAMRSHILPSSSMAGSSQNAMSLDLSMDVAQLDGETSLNPEWDSWGEESTIQVCEVSLHLRNINPVVTTRTLSPITDASHHLTNLVFMPVAPTKIPNENPGAEGSRITPTVSCLAATFLDFGDYTSTPKSEVALYAFKKSVNPGTGESTWVLQHTARRKFEDKVIEFVLPSPTRASLLAGLMDLSGNAATKGKEVQASIGRLQVLKLHDLSPDDSWEEVPIMSSFSNVGRDVLANIAYSPNRSLLCSVSPTASLNTHIAIHVLPHRRGPSTSAAVLLPSSPQITSVPFLAALAVLERIPPSDVIHTLKMPSVSIELVSDTLYRTLQLLFRTFSAESERWIFEVLGLAIEVYSDIHRKATTDADKANLVARRNAALDIRSLVVCRRAFGRCREGSVFDLDAVWQLVSLSGWVIEFTEELLKECVLAAESTISHATITSTSPLASPIFVHLWHPYSLRRLRDSLVDVKAFRDHVAGLPTRQEHAQIVRAVLTDVVDSSGFDLDRLGRVLNDILQDMQGLDADMLHRSLIACHPAPALGSHLRKAIDRVINSDSINRPRLFVKPADLIDGVSRLSVTDDYVKMKRDVVSKGPLRGIPGVICVRCEGVSEVGHGVKTERGDSTRWRNLEHDWVKICVCGGAWISHSRS